MNDTTKKSITNILIVDDDVQIVRTLDMALSSWNYKTFQAHSISDATKILSEEPQIVLLDIDLPDGSGLDFLKEIKEQHPEMIVVMVTGNVDVNSTIAALRGGAFDFIGKPIHLEELRVTLRNAVETRQLRREIRQMKQQRNAENFAFEQIIGESVSIKKAIETARKVAASDVSSVLLQGETGTGKDLFARAIHFASDRRDAPYLAINCAALPANLIESELFGYEKGAFTDAKNRKEGLFEQADGGTLFLDEIGEMDVALQSKLLRVLEDGKFRRIGGLKEIPTDIRIVAASNRNLKQESTDGNFRLDLYYRLSIIQIDIPPLRERDKDVLLLAKFYIEKNNIKRRDGKKLKGLAKATEKIFKNYEWMGNVRELRNVIERATILEDGELITTEHLPADLIGENFQTSTNSTFVLPAEGIPLADVELELVRQAVERTNGNLSRAAKLLNISRDQVRYRLKKDEQSD